MAPKNWTKGDRVEQANYGKGTILEYNEHHVVIEFDEHGKKTFATRLVQLTTTSEPAPAKAARKRAARKTTKKKVEEPQDDE